MIDHVKEAEALLRSFRTGNLPAEADQAHATLALVEQMERIADLLTPPPSTFKGTPPVGDYPQSWEATR